MESQSSLKAVFRLFGPPPSEVAERLPQDLRDALLAVHAVGQHATNIVTGLYDFDLCRPASWTTAGDIETDAEDLNRECHQAEWILNRVRSDFVTANHAITGGSVFTYDGIRSCAHDIALHFAKEVYRNVQMAEFEAYDIQAPPTHDILLRAIRDKLLAMEPLDGSKVANAMVTEAVKAADLYSTPSGDSAPVYLKPSQCVALLGQFGVTTRQAWYLLEKIRKRCHWLKRDLEHSNHISAEHWLLVVEMLNRATLQKDNPAALIAAVKLLPADPTPQEIEQMRQYIKSKNMSSMR